MFQTTTRLLVFLVLFSFEIRAVVDIDWCKVSCQGGPKHTICEYGCGVSSTVKDCKKSPGLTQTAKNKILRLHNKLRNDIALGKDSRVPPDKLKAKNMLALSYDETIEHTAECWINQCNFEHDKCRDLPGSMMIGQNLAYTATTASGDCTDEKLEKMVNDWYGEITMISANSATYNSFVGGGWGHYTQVIWAETNLTGCGASEYTRPDGMHACLLGCNYGPTGNMQGEPIYKQGEPASGCPAGMNPNKEFPGLCGEIRESVGSSVNNIRLFKLLLGVLLAVLLC